MCTTVACNSTLTCVEKRECKLPIFQALLTDLTHLIFLHAYMLWELTMVTNGWSSHNCMPRLLQMHPPMLINVNESLSSTFEKQQIFDNNGIVRK